MTESKNGWRDKHVTTTLREGFPETCDHTIHPTDEQGRPVGSWVNTLAGDRVRVACRYCDKLYGFIPTPEEQASQERKRKAKESKRRYGQFT